ncbi:MAG: PstS family phosphate ABC transporter substrate-binding protein [Longimicrobiales bacterium]
MRLRSLGIAWSFGVVAACGGDAGQSADGGETMSLEIDGSSTVFPITAAVAEEFMLETEGRARVTVASSGTGGGFSRFCVGEIAITNASREISEGERQQCEQAGVDWVQLPVANDGLSIVVNPANQLECLTVAELREIWRPQSDVRRWSDLRPGLPDEEIHLYGPGTDSGTFDYFTEVIVGEAGASRSDYTASEDDNVLVQGVAGDENALGYFGYAYYEQNQDRLELLGVDGGEGCVRPNPRTIESGQYAPLSRPLFIYVNRDMAAQPDIREFLRFYMEIAPELARQVGYIPLEAGRYQANLRELGGSGADTTSAGAAP